MKKHLSNKPVWFAFLIALLFGNFTQPPLHHQSISGLEQQIDALIKPLLDSARIAGVTIGVMRNDSVLLLKAYGSADLELNVPLPTNASFEIGSMTKQFTAVAIRQLVDKGLLRLNDPIDNYLTFNTKPYTVTIGQLLNHISGLKSPPTKEYRELIQHDYPRDTLLRFIEKEGFDFEPGTAMMYSNTGYFILGLLIEKVTGKAYEAYLSDNVFPKAGMANTYYSDAETVRKWRAHGYNNLRNDRRLIRAELPYYRWTYSAGALSSTMEDLLRWNKALHSHQQLISKEGYQQLITPGQLANGKSLRYANGLQLLTYKGHRVIGHGGSGSGFLSQSCYFPDQHVTVVTLQNTYRPVSESELAYAIADKVLPSGRKETKETFKGNLSAYQGTYKGVLEIKVELAGTNLVIKRPWQKAGDTLTYVGNQEWALNNDHYSFGVENGQVRTLYWDAIYAYITLKK